MQGGMDCILMAIIPLPQGPLPWSPLPPVHCLWPKLSWENSIALTGQCQKAENIASPRTMKVVHYIDPTSIANTVHYPSCSMIHLLITLVQTLDHPPSTVQNTHMGFTTHQESDVLKRYLEDFQQADMGGHANIIQKAMGEIYECWPPNSPFNKKEASKVLFVEQCSGF